MLYRRKSVSFAMGATTASSC